MITYTIEGEHIYLSNDTIKKHIGCVEKTDTIRIDNTTIEDITYLFDLELGKYVEQSRIQRDEPLPIPEPSPEEKIAQLELESADVWYELMLKDAIIQQHDLDISELYYITMTGGA